MIRQHTYQLAELYRIVAAIMAQDPESADAAGTDVAPGGAARKARKPNPLANRIKRLMQTDEDVGKIAQASPALIGSAP